MAHSTSFTLLQKLVDRDDDAWKIADFYYRRMVLNWCTTKRGISYEEAEDVANETMFRAANSIGNFSRLRTGSFRCWLRTIALNIVRDRAKKAQQEGLPAIGGTDFQMMAQSIESVADAPQEDFDKEYFVTLVMDKLGRAEEANVRAFIEIFILQRPGNDVADELGIRRASVRRLAHRIGERLQNALNTPEVVES